MRLIDSARPRFGSSTSGARPRPIPACVPFCSLLEAGPQHEDQSISSALGWALQFERISRS